MNKHPEAAASFTSTNYDILIKSVSAIMLLLLSALAVSAQKTEAKLNIIPAPLSVKKQSGELIFSQLTIIKVNSQHNKAADYLKRYLIENWKFNNKISVGEKAMVTRGQSTVTITDKGAENLSDEAYQLTITPKGIVITGKSAGQFYAVQTLIQLFTLQRAGTAKLPCVIINDEPRFEHRGLMLDVARHFFSVADVKRMLDQMAAYKMNRFQWHLTDNQGWRIEIKKYPKLTSVGAYRDLTLFGGNRDWPDSLSYGGYYTQEQIKEVVRYAADRFITVVPEIEMPGHSGAALRAYPELKCVPPAASTQKQQYDILYCPTEQTFTFLENVLTEVINLFPSKYIHIGGDEAWKLPWRESAFCQQLIRDLKLKDDKELQSYFIQRMEKFINSKGRSIIGWDEILEGGLAPNATVMSWRGEAGGIAAAQQKHRVIMSPSSAALYFDYYQSTSSMEPFNYSGYAPLWKTYSYNPVPASLNKQQQQYIAGVQANIWTEGIATPAKLEYMYLPRMLALAEVAWTALENKNYKNFAEERLANHLAKFDAAGINYRVPEAFHTLDTTMIGSRFTVRLRNPVPGAKIYYTLNGRIPGDNDSEYSDPITFKVPANEKRELQTLVITPHGRRSVANRIVMYNQPQLPACNCKPSISGLKYRLFKGKFTTTAQLEYAPAIDSGIVPKIAIETFKKSTPAFGVIMEGYIRMEKDGVYNFYLSSDEGAQLYVDNEKVVDNDKPYLRYERNGAMSLAKGFHHIMVTYFSKSGAGLLRTYLQPAGGAKIDLSGTAFYH